MLACKSLYATTGQAYKMLAGGPTTCTNIVHHTSKWHNNNEFIYRGYSLISAKALFCRRALFGAMRILSFTRMASLIRTRLSDLCTQRKVDTFGEETFRNNCTPGLVAKLFRPWCTNQ